MSSRSFFARLAQRVNPTSREDRRKFMLQSAAAAAVVVNPMTARATPIRRMRVLQKLFCFAGYTQSFGPVDLKLRKG